jgi:hypothetical protein
MRSTRKEKLHNKICVSIVKRNKRMRDAGRPVALCVRMRERAYSFNINFRVRRGARLETTCDPQREI